LGILIAPIDITPKLKLNMYESLRTRLDAGMLELPPDPQLRTDLLNIRKKATSDSVKIDLKVTADGRHCDLGAMLALLCGRYLVTPDALPTKKPTRLELFERELDEEGDENPPEFLGDDTKQDGLEAAHSW
jgi:hypothetical protein